MRKVGIFRLCIVRQYQGTFMKHILCCKFSLYHPVEAVLVVKVIEAYEQCKEISKRKILFMEGNYSAIATGMHHFHPTMIGWC